MNCHICGEEITSRTFKRCGEYFAHVYCDANAGAKAYRAAFDEMFTTLEILRVRLFNEQAGQEGHPNAVMLRLINNAQDKAKTARGW